MADDNKKMLMCARVLGKLDRARFEISSLEKVIQEIRESVVYNREEWENGELNAVCVQVLSIAPADLHSFAQKVDEAHRCLEAYVSALEKKLASST